MKGAEKTLAERDEEFLQAYMNLSREGEEAMERIARGLPVDSDALWKASSSFRTAVKNRHKAAKKYL